MYPQQNETTPQAATMPAQTVNSRWLICQIAGASVMYSDMAVPPRNRADQARHQSRGLRSLVSSHTVRSVPAMSPRYGVRHGLVPSQHLGITTVMMSSEPCSMCRIIVASYWDTSLVPSGTDSTYSVRTPPSRRFAECDRDERQL